MSRNPPPADDFAVTAIHDALRAEPITLTVERLAYLLGQKRDTVYRMLADGDIPATKLTNGRWLIYTSAVRRWLITTHTNQTPGDHS